ncbi:hypothetical protein AAES_129633 [Amazona aestiva]|uniref:Uncharacterized protein n=1 Tax=Amazona aestiva TaxID=12930 RepID=A0A0Q3P864_AMAAE|nr:hypothetical protein AAES_129633 [Amazona aestiva]
MRTIKELSCTSYYDSFPMAVGQAQISCRDLHRRGSISSLVPPPHINVELAHLFLLSSTDSQLPQLIKQNGVQSIRKMKLCLKVILHASSHTELLAQQYSYPDVAKQLTEAVSTYSLRHQFDHKLIGIDSYRNS